MSRNVKEDLRDNHRFAISTHRGGARHRVRYVERGGGADDSDECRLCQPTIKSHSEKSEKESAKR